MTMGLRLCPHCDCQYDRCVNGKHCPLCDGIIERGMRKCPACKQIFKQCVKADGKVYCPNYPACGVELYFPNSTRLRGQTVLAADKDCAQAIVVRLEQHISNRNALIFVYDGSERNGELVHAYALLDRSKTFLKRNNSSMSPHDFTLEVIEQVLGDKYWSEKLVTLRQLRNDISKIAMELYRQKKLNDKINVAHKVSSIDFRPFELAWD